MEKYTTQKKKAIIGHILSHKSPIETVFEYIVDDKRCKHHACNTYIRWCTMPVDDVLTVDGKLTWAARQKTEPNFAQLQINLLLLKEEYI